MPLQQHASYGGLLCAGHSGCREMSQPSLQPSEISCGSCTFRELHYQKGILSDACTAWELTDNFISCSWQLILKRQRLALRCIYQFGISLCWLDKLSKLCTETARCRHQRALNPQLQVNPLNNPMLWLLMLLWLLMHHCVRWTQAIECCKRAHQIMIGPNLSSASTARPAMSR